MNPTQRLLTILKNVRALYRYPPGHFYSPLNNVNDAVERTKEEAPFGIQLKAEEQKELLEEFTLYYKENLYVNNGNQGFRYTYNNPFFCETDGTMLFCMLRKYRPKQIIEVGSGHSSAIMLDVAEHFETDTKHTFIEPFPERLYSLFKSDDKTKHQVLTKPVQSIPFSTFEALEENDILFIDSSHVSKYQSDVNYLFFEVLPRLKEGVIIHIHDIFYPFDYPEEWIKRGRAWNEGYLLRAFLQFNTTFEILLFNDFIVHEEKAWFAENMPICLKDAGGSLWMQKVN